MIGATSRTTFDWHGRAGDEPQPGAFMRSDSGRVWFIAGGRRVQVRNTRGETSRHVFELVRWNPDEVPNDARVYRIRWERRRR